MKSTPTLDLLKTSSSVVLLGAGREGQSTYAYLRKKYPQLQLIIADLSPLDKLQATFRETLELDPLSTLVCGENYLDALQGQQLVFKSPGIPPHLEPLLAFEASGGMIGSNMQLFFELMQDHITIGITGTKGKSTTTSIIYAILQQAEYDVRLLGNIGTAPLSILDDSITEHTHFVIEMSSYQLHDLRQSPHYAVLQQIVPEHLTWHGDFEHYVQDKTRITAFQGAEDYLIYNQDDDLPRTIAQASAAQSIPFGLEDGFCKIENGQLVVDDKIVMAIEDVPLHGRFNLWNVMPGIVIGHMLDIPLNIIARAIREFRPLAHRLEFIAQVNGVRYYNDSLATVPEATIAALEGFRPANIILIAGGYDRGVDYKPLADAILRENIRHLILFPTTGAHIVRHLSAAQATFSFEISHVETMQKAVQIASQSAQPDDAVLMSPASASFNLFKDYRERGEQFREAVLALE